jgi:hypothetical protein
MKSFLILLGVIALGFIIVQVYAMSSQRDTETYPYEVETKYDTFEIRNYEASLFSSVKLTTGEYGKSSSQGFSILANYIFGGNDQNEQIAMTSPVAMSLEDSMTVMFMVPKKYKKDALPAPNEPKIVFHEEPAKTVAAIRFGGWADDAKIQKYKAELIAALEAEGIAYTNRFYFLGYNAPYETVNRRNEVIVELDR